MPSKAIAGGLAVAGLAIMIGCAVPMSKEKDKKSSKYKGLIAGVVIGVLMIVAGLVMFFMGGGGGPAINGTVASAVAGSENTPAAAINPLNAATKVAKNTEMATALSVEAAQNKLKETLKTQNLISRAKAAWGAAFTK